MKRIAFLFIALVLPFWCIAQVISSEGITRHVPADYSTIQAAVDAANDGDTILVADGTYYENIWIYSKKFVLASHYILDEDEEHIKNTIIDGSKPVIADSASVIMVRNCSGSGPLISGFTITGGGGKENSTIVGMMRAGGGILVEFSGATIEHNIITDNVVTDPDFSACGGGISAYNNVAEMQVIIRDNKIHDNHIQSPTYTQGAGLYVVGANGLRIIEDNDVFENTSTCTGPWKANAGGIMLATEEAWATPIIVRNNRIANNEILGEAGQGAGIFLTFPTFGNYNDWEGRASIEIYNNLIVDNFSSDKGGGIALWDQTRRAVDIANPNPLIFNNTIVNNTAKEGGSLFNFRMNPLLFNNIMWNNAGEGASCEISLEDTNYPNRSWSNDGIVQCMYNDIKGGFAGTGNINKEPLWLDGTYAPDSLNRCIGRGSKSVKIGMYTYKAPTKDYKDNPRPNPIDDLVDLGAIESSFPVGVISNRTYNTFRLFPNPATDHVVLLADQYRKYALEVYSSNGQIVKQNNFTGSSCHLDISSFDKGMYVLVLRAEGKVWTNTFIKQ